MKNITCHAGKLEILKRESNSRNGNPRYRLRVDGWTCWTAPDSDLAYQVQNLDGKSVSAHIGTHYGRATLLDAKKLYA